MPSTSRTTSTTHLAGDVAPVVKFYPEGITSLKDPYASVDITSDLVVFVNAPQHAQALADAFADVAAKFGMDPVRAYVTRQARAAVAEFRAWLETPAGHGHADQYRYAEFAGRLATLVDELTGTPEAVAE